MGAMKRVKQGRSKAVKVVQKSVTWTSVLKLVALLSKWNMKVAL